MCKRRKYNAALPAMQDLTQITRQSTHLVIHFANRFLVVAQVDSPEPMGFGVRLGANFPFRPNRVSSCVLSAFQPESVQEELIAALLEDGSDHAKAAKVRTTLADIQDKGFYMAQSDTVNGVTDLCARCLTTVMLPSQR